MSEQREQRREKMEKKAGPSMGHHSHEVLIRSLCVDSHLGTILKVIGGQMGQELGRPIRQVGGPGGGDVFDLEGPQDTQGLR